MAALFALGVMSLVWMAFVAALIAVEKLLPWQRVATFGIAALLLALAIADVRRAACAAGTDDPERQDMSGTMTM